MGPPVRRELGVVLEHRVGRDPHGGRGGRRDVGRQAALEQLAGHPALIDLVDDREDEVAAGPAEPGRAGQGRRQARLVAGGRRHPVHPPHPQVRLPRQLTEQRAQQPQRRPAGRHRPAGQEEADRGVPGGAQPLEQRRRQRHDLVPAGVGKEGGRRRVDPVDVAGGEGGQQRRARGGNRDDGARRRRRRRIAGPCVLRRHPHQALASGVAVGGRDERQEQAASHELERSVENEGARWCRFRRRHHGGDAVEQLGVAQRAEAGPLVAIVEVIRIDVRSGAVGVDRRTHPENVRPQPHLRSRVMLAACRLPLPTMCSRSARSPIGPA